MTLADRTKERAEHLKRTVGLSVNKLNSLAGLSDGYLSRIAQGQRKKVDVVMLERLAAALGVTVDWLQRGLAPTEPPPLPSTVDDIVERARVALRVAVARSVPVELAASRLRAWTKPQVSTAALVQVACGEDPDDDGEVPPDRFELAFLRLTRGNPAKASAYWIAAEDLRAGRGLPSFNKGTDLAEMPVPEIVDMIRIKVGEERGELSNVD